MKRALNVLIVSPWLPHATVRHAGGQHLYHTIRAMAGRGHNVHVLCYGRGERVDEIAPLKTLCASLTVVTPAYTWAQKFAHVWRGGWRRPWLLGRRTHVTVRAHIRTLCRDQQIDVVHFAWTEMGRYLDAVPGGVGTVLGTQDVEFHVRPREVMLHPPGLERLRAIRRARRLIQIERHAVKLAHVILVCSAHDRELLLRLNPAAKIVVVPPWIDLDTMRALSPDSIVPGRLTFLGALDRLANQAAARWLIAEVWPLVRQVQPGATLHIVGASPPDTLRQLAVSDSRVTITGFVPDIATAWAATDVAVGPSLVGGGLLTKVAQPMAAGRPVVTTSTGNEGTDALAGIAIEVADDPHSFAAAALRLLADRDHWRRIAAAGQQHARHTYAWQPAMDQVEFAYRQAAATPTHL
jgi:glycosyltransferase involved in cell wall biosynthesis